MLERITSAANPLLKDVRHAISRGGVTRQGWCVAETFHLLEEALRSHCDVKMVLVAESARASVEARLTDIKAAVIPDALFQSISGAGTAQGVMALVNPPAWGMEQIVEGTALVAILDGVQDPGNAGAIVRAAEAFGATGAIFLKGTASPYNPKTLRASAGSLFRLPVLHGLDAAYAHSQLDEHKLQLFAGVPTHGNGASLPIDAADFTASCALIIGSEARGVSARLRSAAREVSIPTVGVESLNAAMAAGILLYEARRQRTGRA